MQFSSLVFCVGLLSHVVPLVISVEFVAVLVGRIQQLITSVHTLVALCSKFKIGVTHFNLNYDKA